MTPQNISLTNAPHPDQFPTEPTGWFLFCHERDLRAGPVSRQILHHNLVAFRTSSGETSILDARCSHLGADLSKADIHNNCLRCPYHHWEYAPDGRCTNIPAQTDIPSFARQRTYAASHLGPYLFVNTARKPLYPLPFFNNQNPADFIAASPYSFHLNCPWYFVGANGFDRQHFAAAHDRVLTSGPTIDSPTTHSRRSSSQFQVAGKNWQDSFTRLFSGNSVNLTHTDYAGILIYATAKFRRTTSYGQLSILPLSPTKTKVTLITWLPKSKSPLALLDPLHLRIRKYFIKKFLEPDAQVLQGCTYHPRKLIAADAIMADYFSWLASTASHIDSPQPQPAETTT